METTSRVGPQEAPGAPAAEAAPAARRAPGAERVIDGYLMASFPWYGLDEAFTGPRWLMRVGTTADGTVEHGAVGHGDPPSRRAGPGGADTSRFAVVVTVARRPVRSSSDGTGLLEATSASSAAWLAGSGLLSCTWPARLERGLRDDWLEQQTALAWDLADDLDGPAWSTLVLPIDGVPMRFRYRESGYGWVLAGPTRDGVYIGAYGRGMSAYGLGFSVVRDIGRYDR